MIDNNGWILSLSNVPVRYVPSPNFDQRPEGDPVSLLVVHNISLPPGQFGGGYVEQLFCNQLASQEHPYFAEICHLQVSAHVLIDREGLVTQFVSFNDRAWHAGQSDYQGRCNCNDFSIGIELEGCDTEPFAEVQYWRLEWLTRALLDRYPDLTRERIVGHEHIAPGRKTDPGPYFNWTRFRASLEK